VTKIQCLLTYLIVGLLSLMTFSCQKQKSPNIENNEFRGSREMARLQACSNVNFNKGVLLYKNALDLFVCSRWDEQFPSMYQSMKKVSAASWDHVMGPLDESFISNQERRDRFLKMFMILIR
jgi:hypothetical protein